jgi:cytochrome c-type biogenesis protein CcmH
MREFLVLAILLAGTAAFLLAPFVRSKVASRAPATATVEETPNVARRKPRVDGLTAVAIAAVIVLGAVLLYAVTRTPTESEVVASAPNTPGQASRPALPDVDTMMTRLADRLKKNPADSEGWRMLGWSYFETQRFPQAVDAYRKAVSLSPGTAALQSAYGEALVSASSGSVTPAALDAFRRANAADRKDERARFYLALALKQDGNAKGALAAWLAELRNVPADSVWSPRLRTEIAATAKALHVDVSADVPPAPALPDSDFAKAAANAPQIAGMPPSEQQAMIANMVEGLDQRLSRAPNDPEGWVRLIRSRKVLGQMDKARAALARALTAFQSDAKTQERIRTAAAGLGVTAN